jgi:hypothetical protein
MQENETPKLICRFNNHYCLNPERRRRNMKRRLPVSQVGCDERGGGIGEL